MMTYGKLCTQFYDLDKPTAPSKDLDLIVHHCKLANGPIHEAMCGSGRFLVPLAELGYDIDGSDASVDMLAACRAKDPNVKTIHQTLVDLQLTRQYGLIFIASGSFSLIIDPAEVSTILTKLLESLLPGGKLLIEVERVASQESHSWPWGGRWIDLSTGERLLLSWIGSYNAQTRISRSLLRYELIGTNGKVLDTEIETFDLQMYEPESFESNLRQAGFVTTEQLPANDHSSLLFLAGKSQFR